MRCRKQSWTGRVEVMLNAPNRSIASRPASGLMINLASFNDRDYTARGDGREVEACACVLAFSPRAIRSLANHPSCELWTLIPCCIRICRLLPPLLFSLAFTPIHTSSFPHSPLSLCISLLPITSLASPPAFDSHPSYRPGVAPSAASAASALSSGLPSIPSSHSLSLSHRHNPIATAAGVQLQEVEGEREGGADKEAALKPVGQANGQSGRSNQAPSHLAPLHHSGRLSAAAAAYSSDHSLSTREMLAGLVRHSSLSWLTAVWRNVHAHCCSLSGCLLACCLPARCLPARCLPACSLFACLLARCLLACLLAQNLPSHGLNQP